MLRAVVLLQVTLWVATIQAFYIWNPDAPSGSSGKLDGLSERGEDGVTFRLSQRLPQVVHEPVAQAARLARKYSSKASQGSALDRRANNYRFVKATAPSLPNSAGVNQEGSDLYYFMTVGFGSAQKPMLMLLDSGAGTSWVMGSTCQSTPCSKHDSFGPADSQTYRADSRTFSINYGSGSVGGNLVKDTVSVAGLKLEMAFGEANVTSDDFNSFPFDGILGLSPTTGATDNFLKLLKDAKLVNSNIFALSLSRTSDGPNAGEITFGATNPDKYVGSIEYTSTTEKGGDWAISLDEVGFNGQKAGVSSRKTFIDTGTSFAFGSPTDVAAIHKLVPGAQSTDGATFQVPCTTTQPITVTFSGVTYNISIKDWISPPDKNGICTSRIYGHEVIKGAWLLGDIFLKNVYTVFDFDESRIGFANKPAVTISSTTTMSSPMVVSTVPATTFTTNGVVTTLSASTVTTSVPSPSLGPGLSGHETPVTAGGTAPSGATGIPASTTQSSPGEQVGSNAYVSIICIVAVVAMVA